MNDTTENEKAIAPAQLHPETRRLLEYFRWSHLPAHLQEISKGFARQAVAIAQGPGGPEATAALRKLLESKDCAVRAGVKRFEGSDHALAYELLGA